MTNSVPPAPHNLKSPAAIALAATFILAAATSNWAIHNVGSDHGPDAPRTVPIGWGLEAPSGVVLIGVMIATRDALHERIGLRGTLAAILVASISSALFAPPSVALASGATMIAAEVADALVYERLRARGRIKAAALSNLVSAFIDSAMFLLIAFGLTAAVEGTLALTLGKLEASLVTLAALVVVARVRRSITAPTTSESAPTP